MVNIMGKLSTGWLLGSSGVQVSPLRSVSGPDSAERIKIVGDTGKAGHIEGGAESWPRWPIVAH
jgi:hypothetical protein